MFIIFGEIGFSAEYEQLKRQLADAKEKYAAWVVRFNELLQVIKPAVQARYMVEIGVYEYQIYSLDVQIARAKREIAIYQAAANQGRKVEAVQVQQLLDQEFAEFKKKLGEQAEKLLKAKNFCEGKFMTPEEAAELKDLFHLLVKKLHPDTHPDLPETAQQLWHQVMEAWKTHNLEWMRLYADMAEAVLQGETEMAEPDTLDKIREQLSALQQKIEQLNKSYNAEKNKPPLIYQAILHDAVALKQKKAELDEVKLRKGEYLDSLKKYIDKLRGEKN